MGLPALLLDQDGTVIEANGLIEAMSDHVQWRVRGRIALTDGRANALLWANLAALDTDPASNVRSFPLRDSGDRAAMVVHMIPVRRSAHDIFAGSYALLVMTPVTALSAPPVELMRSLFDLTASEARVARGLAAGETLEQIASTGGVAISTVRSQLRQVLEKTGCTRQAEIVSLLASVTLDRSTAKN
jgi:DNA-binding CsgD family transcriptional regulator